jgi:hypothetical protein
MIKKILYSFLALVMIVWTIWADIILVNFALDAINAPDNISVFFGLTMGLFAVLLTTWVGLILKDFIKQNILN